MEKHVKRKKICNSLYHHSWFRTLLIIISFNLIALGFAFAIGIDIVQFTARFGAPMRITFGLLYIFTALSLIHYVLSYHRIKETSHFVCHHCLHHACEKHAHLDEHSQNPA